MCSHWIRETRVSLRIVPVRVSGTSGGQKIVTYAFLDDGSDTTLCSNSLAQRLGLSGKPMNFSLSTINKEHRPRNGYEVELSVKALKSEDGVHLDKVWNVDRLPISQQSILYKEDTEKWPHLRGIEFPRLDGKVMEILIGNDNAEAHWIFEQRCGRHKQPYSARTLLGWTLISPMDRPSNSVGHVKK